MKRWRISVGVAHRLADSGLVVDLRGDENRAAFVEAPIHQLIEVRGSRRPA
jgi:hypothetical protein